MSNLAQIDLDEKYITRAIEYARRSTIKRHKTGAVIVGKQDYRGSAMVASGWSHDSLFSLVSYRSIHAEIHAILRCDRKLLTGATVYIATLTQADNCTLSRPCDQCLATLYEVGVARAVYTVDDSEIESLAIK